MRYPKAFFIPPNVSRHAIASPFLGNGDDCRQRRKQGGAVGAAASRMQATAKQTLGAATRAVAPKVTERASPARKSRCAAMGRLFVRAILSSRSRFFVSILALSVTFGDTARVAAPSVCFATARILLAAAPTAPPCFRHWRRSSPLLPKGEALAGRKAQKPPFGDCCSERGGLSDKVPK